MVKLFHVTLLCIEIKGFIMGTSPFFMSCVRPMQCLGNIYWMWSE